MSAEQTTPAPRRVGRRRRGWELGEQRVMNSVQRGWEPAGLSLTCSAVPVFCSDETGAVPIAVAAGVVPVGVAVTPIAPAHQAVIPSILVTVPESIAEAPSVVALTVDRAGVGLARRCRCCRHRLQAKWGKGEDEDRTRNGRSLTEPCVHDRTPLQHRSHRSLLPY